MTVIQEIQADLAEMVGFPTVSNRPVTELAAHLAQRAEDLGLRVERFDDPDQDGKCTVIAVAGPGPGPDGEGLTITGHMDVVPTEGQPWSSDPFALTERDGRLYGRGTADMKGFLASTHAALARIPVARLRRPLALVWTHDEEIGCLGSAKLVEAWRRDGRILPRACLVGEPTDFRILRMHPGHVAVELELSGVAAHSSRPDLGVNAIEAAARVVEQIRQLAEELRSERADLPELERPFVAVNVARIEGGSAVNIVPDRCVITMGYRPLPGMEPTEPWSRLLERLERLDPPVQLEGRIQRITPSMLTPEGTRLQAQLAPHASAPGCGAAGFATDGGNLAALGLQPLVFGPGSIDVAHKADEHVSIDALAKATDVVGALIQGRCL
ncbi:MAG TPA: acetylornithine deacetylase [Deltaproteobacteria bacterium]|nr:acetylornithine deacetylase [Deltaproteobacteria bacterium]